MTQVIDNGGDAAEPNSRVSSEALEKREKLVDGFEAASSRFKSGDRVVVQNLTGKPKYNGKPAVVRGTVNASLRFPVTVEMRDGPETILLKAANLRLAAEKPP